MCVVADKTGDKLQTGEELVYAGDKLGRGRGVVDSFSTYLPHTIHGVIHRLSTSKLWTKTECLPEIRFYFAD